LAISGQPQDWSHLFVPNSLAWFLVAGSWLLVARAQVLKFEQRWSDPRASTGNILIRRSSANQQPATGNQQPAKKRSRNVSNHQAIRHQLQDSCLVLASPD
jgi:hypothetical protein